MHIHSNQKYTIICNSDRCRTKIGLADASGEIPNGGQVVELELRKMSAKFPTGIVYEQHYRGKCDVCSTEYIITGKIGIKSCYESNYGWYDGAKIV